MKLALAMIVRGVDKEAEGLKTCLNSVANIVDKMFIAVTFDKGSKPSETFLKLYDISRAESSQLYFSKSTKRI